jgi:hypothetical protein
MPYPPATTPHQYRAYLACLKFGWYECQHVTFHLAARKGSQHAAEEIIITLGLPRFQSGQNHFQWTGRVDFDAGSLFDFPGRAPPDQHAERRIVECPPHRCRGQARDGLAVDAQATCETLVPSAGLRPARAAFDTCLGPFEAPDGGRERILRRRIPKRRST